MRTEEVIGSNSQGAAAPAAEQPDESASIANPSLAELLEDHALSIQRAPSLAQWQALLARFDGFYAHADWVAEQYAQQAAELAEARLARLDLEVERDHQLARTLSPGLESSEPAQLFIGLPPDRSARGRERDLEMTLASFHLPTLVDEVRAAILPRARRAGVAVSAEVQVAAVTADRELIRRLLQHLLDHTVRSAPSCTGVCVEAMDECGGTLLRVRAVGRGLFRRYVLDHVEAAAFEFCRLAVQAHHGVIWIDEDRREGALLCVWLPASAPILEHGLDDQQLS